MKEYDKIIVNGDVPKAMKLIMLFIDRVGFPVLAFCLMFWMAYISLQRMTDAIQTNTVALTEFSARNVEFCSQVARDHKAMLDTLSRTHRD